MMLRTAMIAVWALLFCATALSAQRFEVPDVRGMRWFKGNTHAHTTNSDGDSPPDVVARWYRDHGYHFLVLSDHNVFTDPRTLASLVDSTFLLIPGEELTSSYEKKPIHVNGLDVPGVIAPRTDSTLVGTVQKNVDAVREVNGVPHINHPNYVWAISKEALSLIQRNRLIEIFNGHPLVNNVSAGGADGMEEVWDHLLTRGRRVYGIAVDDAHSFKEFSKALANPGRGWISIRARTLNTAELMRNLEQGLFYASTGVELDDVIVTATSMEVRVRPNRDFRYTIEFIGDGGRVLARVNGLTARYQLRKGVTYVRARVKDTMGDYAWVQPVFVVK